MLLTRGFLVVLCATSLASGQKPSKKQLTARELFYAATTAAAKPPEPAKPDPPKPEPAKAPGKTAAVKNTVRPVQPKPVEVAQADQTTPVRPVVRKTAPMPANGQMPLGLRVNVMRYNSDGSTTDVLPDAVFHSGDRIRLSVESNAGGYLYIANQGSSGKWTPMFPSAEIQDGDNRAEAMRSYTMPPGNRVFTFDATAGQEVLFVVLSREPVADFEDLMYKLKNGRKASDPEPPARADKQLIMASIDNKTVERLRRVYSRDLIIESVDSSTPGDKKETAMFFVNPTGSADACVTADIHLVHQ